MVDVGHKPVTAREAAPRGLSFLAATLRRSPRAACPRATCSRGADRGIMAAKKCGELIRCATRAGRIRRGDFDLPGWSTTAASRCGCTSRVAGSQQDRRRDGGADGRAGRALTVYDMCKAIERICPSRPSAGEQNRRHERSQHEMNFTPCSWPWPRWPRMRSVEGEAFVDRRRRGERAAAVARRQPPNADVTFHAAPGHCRPGRSQRLAASGPTYDYALRNRLCEKLGPAVALVWEMKKPGYAAAVLGARLVLFQPGRGRGAGRVPEAQTGQRHWAFGYPAVRRPLGYSDGPRASPVIGGDASSPSAPRATHCLELATGRVRWKRTSPPSSSWRRLFGVGSNAAGRWEK